MESLTRSCKRTSNGFFIALGVGAGTALATALDEPWWILAGLVFALAMIKQGKKDGS